MVKPSSILRSGSVRFSDEVAGIKAGGGGFVAPDLSFRAPIPSPFFARNSGLDKKLHLRRSAKLSLRDFVNPASWLPLATDMAEVSRNHLERNKHLRVDFSP